MKFFHSFLSSILWVSVCFIGARLYADPVFVGQKINLEFMSSPDEAEFVRLHVEPRVKSVSSQSAGFSPALEFRNAVTGAELVQSARTPLTNLRWQDPRLTALGFKVLANSKVVGFIHFREAHIKGYWESFTSIDPAFWDKGFETEACPAANDFMFQKLEVPGLISIVSPFNKAQIKLNEEMGFLLTDRILTGSILGKQTLAKEFRLSRERAMQSAPLRYVPTIHPGEKNLLGIIEKGPAPIRERAAFFYKVLMLDLHLRRRLSLEEWSRHAELLAVSSHPGIDAVDATYLRLMLTVLRNEFGEKLKARFGLSLLRFDLEKSSTTTIGQRYDLVAMFVDGRRYPLLSLEFSLSKQEPLYLQWESQFTDTQSRLEKEILSNVPRSLQSDIDAVLKGCSGGN